MFGPGRSPTTPGQSATRRNTPSRSPFGSFTGDFTPEILPSMFPFEPAGSGHRIASHPPLERHHTLSTDQIPGLDLDFSLPFPPTPILVDTLLGNDHWLASVAHLHSPDPEHQHLAIPGGINAPPLHIKSEPISDELSSGNPLSCDDPPVHESDQEKNAKWISETLGNRVWHLLSTSSSPAECSEAAEELLATWSLLGIYTENYIPQLICWIACNILMENAERGLVFGFLKGVEVALNVLRELSETVKPCHTASLLYGRSQAVEISVEIDIYFLNALVLVELHQFLLKVDPVDAGSENYWELCRTVRRIDVQLGHSLFVMLEKHRGLLYTPGTPDWPRFFGCYDTFDGAFQCFGGIPRITSLIMTIQCGKPVGHIQASPLNQAQGGNNTTAEVSNTFLSQCSQSGSTISEATNSLEGSNSSPDAPICNPPAFTPSAVSGVQRSWELDPIMPSEELFCPHYP